MYVASESFKGGEIVLGIHILRVNRCGPSPCFVRCTQVSHRLVGPSVPVHVHLDQFFDRGGHGRGARKHLLRYESIVFLDVRSGGPAVVRAKDLLASAVRRIQGLVQFGSHPGGPQRRPEANGALHVAVVVSGDEEFNAFEQRGRVVEEMAA